LRRNYNRLLKEKIKGGIEVTRRRGRRGRKLMDDLKERRGYSNLKEEALDRTMWRAGFGGGFVPVVRQTTKTNEDQDCEWRHTQLTEIQTATDCEWRHTTDGDTNCNRLRMETKTADGDTNCNGLRIDTDS
jgi:hypothetical protein